MCSNGDVYNTNSVVDIQEDANEIHWSGPFKCHVMSTEAQVHETRSGRSATWELSHQEFMSS